MPDVLIELTEEPLIGGRQYYNVPARPDQACRVLNLQSVVKNVLENVKVQHTIEGGPVGKRAQ